MNLDRFDQYGLWQLAYFDDPSRFVKDCIEWPKGKGPAPYQIEIMDAIPERKRVSARGPHGLGKSAVMSWLILWFALTRDGLDWKCPTTASVWRQLEDFLWPEVHKWSGKLNWSLIGRDPFVEGEEMMQLKLRLKTGAAFAIASDVPAKIEGVHADHVFYVFDESKSIADNIFDAAEGAFSNAGADTDYEAYAAAMSTPGSPIGRFYDIQRRARGFDDWHVRAVKLDECIRAGRISAEWAEQRKLQWGEESQTYQNRVLGEFQTDSASGVIPMEWLELGNILCEAWHNSGRQGDLTRVALDPAGEGGDEKVIARLYDSALCEAVTLDVFGGREEDKSRYIDAKKNAGLDELINAMTGILNAGIVGVVDAIGMGETIYKVLAASGLRVEAFVANKSTRNKDRNDELGFVSKRDAAWWGLRERLDPHGPYKVAIPPDDTLTGQLLAPSWRIAPGGKIKVETKKDVKKRLGRSTDRADGVVMLMFEEQEKRKVWRVY